MYWVYLALFVLMVLTPKTIQEGIYFLREEDVESLVIFFFGLFGFIIYVIKEKALNLVFREKYRLQKRTNIITKDLSDSYSYIGEMNRKLDIVKDFIFRLPNETINALAKQKSETFRSSLEAVKLLAKTDFVSLRFVNTKTKAIEKIVENGHQKIFEAYDVNFLLSSKRLFREDETVAIARSPYDTKGIVAYIIFSKTSNHVESVDVFKILASQAVLLFYIDHYGVGQAREETHAKS